MVVNSGDSCPANSNPPGYIEAVDPVDDGPLGAPMTPERAVDHLTARSLAHNAQYKLGPGADREAVAAEVRRLNDGLGLGANDDTVTEAVSFYGHAYPAPAIEGVAVEEPEQLPAAEAEDEYAPGYDPYRYEDETPDHWVRGYDPARERNEPFLKQAHERRAAEQAGRDFETRDRLAACADAHEDGSEFHQRIEGGWTADKQLGFDDGGGQGVTVRVRFADGTYGYLKPTAQTEAAEGQHRVLGQTPTEAATHEVAAYHVAQAMGGAWPDMVPPTALVHDTDYGTASVQQHIGSYSMEDKGYGMNADPADHDRVELFDAVIGNRDRHMGNIRTDNEGERMWMIDHGFAFADTTAVEGTAELDGDGRDALEELRAHPDGCGGVASMLGPFKAAAMQARIDTILATGRF